MNDLLLARATFAAAVKRWPGSKITLRNGTRIIEKTWPGGRLKKAYSQARQREKRPAGGALGQRLGNCGGSGGDGADCPSVPSGLATSVESGIGGFFGGSTTTVCGRRSLRADLTCLDGLLASTFGGFFGGITGGLPTTCQTRVGGWSIGAGGLGGFSDSTQRKNASFNSSIAAQPARPKLADRAIRTSAIRARARIDTLVIRRVAPSLNGF